MNTIFVKLVASIIILFLIVLLPLGFTINQIFINFNHSHLREETVEMVRMYSKLAEEIEDQNQKVNHIVDSISIDTTREIIITNDEGEIIGNSGISGFITDSNTSAIGTIKEFMDPHTRQEYFYSSQLMSTSSEKQEIHLFTPINTMHKTVEKLQDAIILSIIGALLLAFGFTFIISRKITTPLQKMEKAARQIAKGNLDLTLPVTTNDELGSLSHSMNELVHDLKTYRLNRQEFFSSVSHELRTPLSYLQGYTDALKRGLYKTEEEKQRFIGIIHDEALRMNRLINDLFELSRMEIEQFPLELQVVQVEDVIRDTVSKFEGVIEAKDIQCKLFIEGTIPMIVVDVLRFEQILTNLLQNALKYTAKGKISISVWTKQEKVKISVSDTGIGITEEELPYIFERFYRVEKSRARSYGGTGLGLAIVKQLTELQYGTIDVVSQIGKGTTFTLVFPWYKEESNEDN